MASKLNPYFQTLKTDQFGQIFLTGILDVQAYGKVNLEIVQSPHVPVNMTVSCVMGKLSGTTLGQVIAQFPLGSAGVIHSIAVVGPEFFQEGFFIEHEQHIALFYLNAFGEAHFIHKRLDAGAHLDVLRRIELADKRRGQRHLRWRDFHDLHERRRQYDGRRFLATTEERRGQQCDGKADSW